MDDEEILHRGPGFTIALAHRPSTLIPYWPADRADGDRNHGFFDLRDNPAGVDQIPETEKLAGLAQFLRTVAVHSELMTSGCEAAVFERGPEREGPRFQAGSFVVVAFRDAERNRDVERFKGLAGQTLGRIQPTTDHRIGFEMLIEPLRTFFGQDGCFAIEMKGIGYGESEEEAWRAVDYAMSALAKAIPPSPRTEPNEGEP